MPSIIESVYINLSQIQFQIVQAMILISVACAFLNVKFGSWALAQHPHRQNKFNPEVFIGRISGSIFSMVVFALCAQLTEISALIDIYVALLSMFMIKEIDSSLSVFGVDLKILVIFADRVINLLSRDTARKVKNLLTGKITPQIK